MKLMKGLERYNFIKQKHEQGLGYEEIAPLVGLKSDTAVRVFMSRNKSKFEMDNKSDNNDNKSDNTLSSGAPTKKSDETSRRAPRSKKKQITVSDLIDLATKESKLDEHNHEFDNFIRRALDKDQYLIRTAVKLFNKI